jgi:imidazolonepropionase
MNMLITNIAQIATPIGRAPISGLEMNQLTVYEEVDLLIRDGRIEKIGKRIQAKPGDHVIDAKGCIALPGFVDPHTHAVFAGTREEEFLARVQGAPYDKGGILSTAHAVSHVDENVLVENALSHVRRMLAYGTTTLEIKSGYGLSLDGEMKLLLAIRQLKRSLPMEIVPTFLGAHAFPEEMARDDYISNIITEMLPAVRRHHLARFCDVFCDKGFYSVAEARAILRAARGAGLGLKIHADELAPVGAAELAADLEATSADHLLHVTDHGMRRLKEAGVVAVLLPGTAFTLGTGYAPARRMIELGLAVALASDFNPGTCLIDSMFTIIGLAVMKMRLSVEEAITAATLNAAGAVELSEEVGSLEKGKRADLTLLNLATYRQIPYFFAHNPVYMVISGGEVVYELPT